MRIRYVSITMLALLVRGINAFQIHGGKTAALSASFIDIGRGWVCSPSTGTSRHAPYGRRRFAPLPQRSIVSPDQEEGIIEEEDQVEGGDLLPEPKKQQPKRKTKPWQGPFEYHQELVLRVESLTNLGKGICRTGEDAFVVMVPSVIPGELVRIRIFRNHKNYSEADLMEVLEPSPDRIESKCSLFGLCGGCQYQHMTIQAQREWKRQHVLDVLQRTGNITDIEVQPVMGTDEAYSYRSKITPHHEKPRSGEIREIGFLKMESRSLVDVNECIIATPAINARLGGLREEVRAAARKQFQENPTKKAKGATLFLRETNEGVVTDTREEVSDTVNHLAFRYTAGSFFQNNAYVLPHMVSYVVGKAKATNLRYLVDAYCGGGLFCLSASRDFETCYGVEISELAVFNAPGMPSSAASSPAISSITSSIIYLPSYLPTYLQKQTCYGVEISELAVLSARRNAELNGITNCHFRAGDASDIFAGIRHIQGKETVVIIDPPRKGCDQEFLDQLFTFRPARCVYVSCDAATQARDAQEFIKNGYGIEEVQPFDLFPQTRHIENVITFRDERFSAPGYGPVSSDVVDSPPSDEGR